MKKIISLIAIFYSLLLQAQVPQGISYQAIALNATGNPLVNTNIGLRLSILNSTATGTTLYSETHIKTTNAQGLYSLVIGQGTVGVGTFAGINWGTNSKFLKVEIDVAGGNNFVLVGTTQLLSVPYALTSGTIRTAAGQGITLTSPNGTTFNLSVSDSGVLTLPNSNSENNYPATLYTYGTFNSFTPATALLMSSIFGSFTGFKYFTAGTELKFIAQNNAASPVYGIGFGNEFIQNGSAFTIPSNGFYNVFVGQSGLGGPLTVNAFSIAPKLIITGTGTEINPTYNVATNTFSFIVNNIVNSNTFLFSIPLVGFTGQQYGDNLSDGTIEQNGAEISFPGANSTPKNYRVDLVINFNGSGTYTIVQI